MKCYQHPELDAIGLCKNCGRGICQSCAVEVRGILYCKECLKAGMPPAPGIAAAGSPLLPRRKSPALAAVASFFVPGAGNIYAGRMGDGVLLLVFWLIVSGLDALVLLSLGQQGYWLGLLFTFLMVVAVVTSMITAYRAAAEHNARLGLT